ncbi:alpha/beta hydrolase [Acrocarpospora catenulata]|uniref:alpha/beta hydrolase n=1 Tax=Acrocarpospora catenulata TaxID=2836182 RepID=UPI001BDADE59|nr:alpha/beta hydrolase [Acrocarpospora catenulata]
MDDINVDVRPTYPVSWQAAACNGLLRGTMKPISSVLLRHSMSLVVAQRLIAFGGRVPGLLPGMMPTGTTITPDDLGGCPGEWVRGGEELDEGKVVLYLHGGGYFIGSPVTHRPITWRLSMVTRRPVLALDYRQGPVNTLADSLADSLAAYRALLERGHEPEGIILAGDSAGGHLTLATLLSLRDAGLPLPAAGICLSPWTDLSDVPRSANRWADPMLPASRVDWLARQWTAGLDSTDPLVSPVYGDYIGIPPLMIVTGSTEVLRAEAYRVAEQARKADVPVRYEEWNRMPHVFALLADIVPEARLVFGHIRGFVEAVETMESDAAAA